MEIVSLSTAKSRRKAIEKLLNVAKVRHQSCNEWRRFACGRY